eukprot:g9322.t1
MAYLLEMIHHGPVKTFTHRRLNIMEARFKLHRLLNHELEQDEQKKVPHRDFYNVRKVDNHIHHSAIMTQKHLLRFIKHKMRTAPDDVVMKKNGEDVTLKKLFEVMGLVVHDLSIDLLDVNAGSGQAYHRFDRFNLKYNPLGDRGLREVFLKTQNHQKGKYLAQLTQQVFDDFEANKYQCAEPRVSIYGKSRDEWDKLATWIVDNKLFNPKVCWMVQLPRLYAVYRKEGLLQNFQEMLDNIFLPLFEATVDPSSHPKLHIFLQALVGVDTVDDESLREVTYSPSLPVPLKWTSEQDPPYSLFSYYIFANLQVLNKLRNARGFGPMIKYRPHGGEAGDLEHLACCFLVANGINHGIMLKHCVPLQYLYYLAQIPMSLSPLSNNCLFLDYEKNPFPRFFARGLNVALSTDDPLMIHTTKEPLVEEYSVAGQVWKLNSVDMCEIARNSVLQSGFPHKHKARWIGNNYWRRHVSGNDIRQTNVPSIRIEFRLELLATELGFISQYLKEHIGLEMLDPL